jgi:DNA polymerase-3 subunit beta
MSNSKSDNKGPVLVGPCPGRTGPGQDKGVEFSIARDILSHAVQTMSASVISKTSESFRSSYLGNLLIVADESGLTLRAADQEAIVSLDVQGALVTEVGKAVVPLELLKDLVSAFPTGGRVDVSTDDQGRTVIKCGRSKSALAANCEPETFPPGNEPEGEGISLDREILVEVLGQVTVAASQDESRPALTGVCFEFSTDGPALSSSTKLSLSKGLTLAAADGFRLATRHLPLASEQEEAKVVLPASSLSRLVRVMGKTDDETVTLHTLDGRAVFQTTGFRMEILAIENKFPDWQQIVPQSHAASVTVDATALRATLRQARLFPASEGYKKTYPIKVEYLNSGENALRQSSGQALRISAANSELGSYTATVPVTDVEGEPATIGLNAAFLLEMLPRLNGTIQMHTNSDSSPVVFTDTHLTYVVMPLVLRS